QYIDLHATDSELPASMRELLEGGARMLRVAAQAARREKVAAYAADQVKLLPPVPNPAKIICLGLNYADHAKEGGVPIARDPVLFSKYPTALIGHGDDIVLPPVSEEVDYEAELVVVVGQRGRNVPAEKAMDYVAGYTIGHD